MEIELRPVLLVREHSRDKPTHPLAVIPDASLMMKYFE